MQLHKHKHIATNADKIPHYTHHVQRTLHNLQVSGQTDAHLR